MGQGSRVGGRRLRIKGQRFRVQDSYFRVKGVGFEFMRLVVKYFGFDLGGIVYVICQFLLNERDNGSEKCALSAAIKH